MSTTTRASDGASPAGTASPLTGTGMLTRLLLRRDRVMLAVWLLLSWGVSAGRAGTREALYPTTEARQTRYDQVMVEVPMFKLFQGPVYGTGIDDLLVQESFGAATLLAALGAVVFVVRHTRTDEQAGRRELLGSTGVGRYAPLAAALAVVFVAGALLAVLTSATMIGAGMPAAGSAVFGLVTGSAVWISAAMAAVAAQLTANPRAAIVGAYSLFFALHFVRGASDLGGPGLAWLGWLVPNGWLQRTQPFAGDRWWPFLLVAALVVVLVYAAVSLADRRDLGSGMLATRPGPRTGPRGLGGPFGLAWRLHRGMALVWVAGTAAICLPTALAGTAAMEQYAAGDQMAEWAAAMGSANPGDALFAYIAFATVFPITLYAIQVVLRMHADESGGHAALLLAGPVSRLRWAAGHLALALAVPAVLLVVVGLCFGVGAGDSATMLATTARLIPAVWVLVGIAIAAYGLAGRVAPFVGYGALGVALTVEFGQHLGWPDWLFWTFSPFAHVLPFFGPPGAGTLLVLTAVAATLIGAGLAGLRRRDLLG
ncbi:ABC-2 type transport system permease protein [Lipingzhangella halophila]|uniref:ABC-2 type transport system permease protein n=1 Tax=Lipingzhangella halophila TaxID=1783352 RepID=A0A7W7RGW3_9ACTN|nr:antibiotic ABC transporter [Lipingzhangella halophila]MBB4931764.1 ABC-2 type transport system permease protein [Lipingzhangella halophila]